MRQTLRRLHLPETVAVDSPVLSTRRVESPLLDLPYLSDELGCCVKCLGCIDKSLGVILMELHQKKCKPCEGGVPPLTLEEGRAMMAHLNDWELSEKQIQKDFKFKNFAEAMRFVNRVADLAESEGHHPDIHISWNRVSLSLTTHAIGGLSENDFILASKIDRLESS